MQEPKIGVIGLGYVGLPVAVAFSERFPGTVGFDIASRRIATLRENDDRTGEIPADRLQRCGLVVSDEPEVLRGCTMFVVTVPTPIDADRRPDLGALQAASRTVGRFLTPGAIVVYESTVYPGVTEEVCGPILEQVSGLRCGLDFTLGYSPERINPGDREHSFERITKVVSGQDGPTLDRVAEAREARQQQSERKRAEQIAEREGGGEIGEGRPEDRAWHGAALRRGGAGFSAARIRCRRSGARAPNGIRR